MTHRKHKRANYPQRLTDFDCDLALRDKAEYELQLDALQLTMLKIQQAYFTQGRRAIIVMEGTDGSGKGGIIGRLVQPLDPRGIHVWPIGAPTSEEKGHHYLYRFWQRLPSRGSLAVFDRSWYGRVLVERVEGFCTEAEWRRAYREIRQFEKLLHEDGVRIVKLMPVISREEQVRRFEERIRNPRKRWKLTADDVRNWHRWEDYQTAFQDMLDKTSTGHSPWHVIAGNRKWYARIQALRIVTETLARDVDISEPLLDPALMKSALDMLSQEFGSQWKKPGEPVDG